MWSAESDWRDSGQFEGNLQVDREEITIPSLDFTAIEDGFPPINRWNSKLTIQCRLMWVRRRMEPWKTRRTLKSR